MHGVKGELETNADALRRAALFVNKGYLDILEVSLSQSRVCCTVNPRNQVVSVLGYTSDKFFRLEAMRLAKQRVCKNIFFKDATCV